ncbi:MAG: TetR/AcrR family transcriptional regulator [Mycobacteriaceae bacterium]
MKTHGYHHGALHEAILQAAVDAARRGGPQAVSVRALAKAAGVSPSAVYRHVPSIEALLCEVAQIARQQLAGRLIECRDGAPIHRTRKASARERFRAIGRGYVEFALAEPHLFDTAFAPVVDPPAKPDDPSAWQVLVDGVGELVNAGIVNPRAADKAALIAWAGVQGIATILVRNALPAPVKAADATDVILDAVMGSLENL